jgi:YmgG-like glycine-zipper protein
MCRWFHWLTLSVFAAVTAVTPALAANGPAPTARDTPPAVLQLPAVPPVAADNAARQPQTVLTARAPFATTWNSTVVSASSQAMGLQASRGGMSTPVKWAITGAAVGAIVGALAGDPLTDAAIGGVVGFGAAYVMHR